MFTNINYDVINTKVNKVFSIHDLTYVKDGVTRVKLATDDIGYYHNPTLHSFVKRSILGMVGTSNIRINVDTDNPYNSVCNSVNMNNALRYRLDNISNATAQEQSCLDMLFDKDIRKQLLLKSGQLSKINQKRPGALDIVYQSIIPVDGRFYIPDLLILIRGLRPFAIELDGSQHHTDSGTSYDSYRDAELFKHHNLSVFRLKNREFDSMNHSMFKEFIVDIINSPKLLSRTNNTLEYYMWNFPVRSSDYVTNSLTDLVDYLCSKVNTAAFRVTIRGKYYIVIDELDKEVDSKLPNLFNKLDLEDGVFYMTRSALLGFRKKLTIK